MLKYIHRAVTIGCIAPLVTLPAVALMIVAPPLAEDREEAEARHALDRLPAEGGYA